MTSKLSVLLKKYSIPTLFFIVAIIMIYVGISQNQDATYMVASMLMLAAGIVSLMYSSGKFKQSVVLITGSIAGIAAVFSLYMSYKSVNDTNTYNKNYVLCKATAVQNLQDIRYIQKAYADKNGKYAATWEELVAFAENGTVPHVIAKGSVPVEKITEAERNYLYGDNRAIDAVMTEVEAYRLSKWTNGPRHEMFKGFVRDTIQISLMDSKFGTKSYISGRENAGLSKFYLDSLPYIPFTNGKKQWKLEVADSVLMGEIKVPAIYVHGKIPFAKIQGTDNEEISFGKLTSNETAGTWED